MAPLLPPSLRDHVDFAEAFDQFGRALLPEEWTGNEVCPPKWDSVLPAEEAAMVEEDKRLRSILKSRGYRDDDEYITQACKAFQLDALRCSEGDPYIWGGVISRLSYLIEVLSQSSALRSPGALALKAMHGHRQRVLTEMLTLLVDGKIVGYCQNEHVRTPIKPELWASTVPWVDIANSKANCCPSGMVVFCRDDFAKIIQQIAMPATEITKMGAANAALAELIRMMSDPSQPRRSKDTVFKDFKKRWPALSRRRFDDLWTDACDRTKTGWDKPGRPREHATKAA